MLTDSSLTKLIYRGDSMHPTLKNGDMVLLSPDHRRSIRRGDIIVFTAPREARKVIHRVAAITMEGYVTKGDHARFMDPWTVKEADICGQVHHIYRGDNIKRLASGLGGHYYARILPTLRLFAVYAASYVRPLYHRLSRTRVFRRVLAQNHAMRIVSLARPAGIEWKLFRGKREIGYLSAGHELWHIKKPYLLFVDESLLPKRIKK